MRRFLFAASLFATIPLVGPSALADVTVPQQPKGKGWQGRCATRLDEAAKAFRAASHVRGDALARNDFAPLTISFASMINFSVGDFRARISPRACSSDVRGWGWTGVRDQASRSAWLSRCVNDRLAVLDVHAALAGFDALFINTMQPALDACLDDALP